MPCATKRYATGLLLALAMSRAVGGGGVPPDGNARIELGPILGAVTGSSAIVWCEVEWVDPAAGVTLSVTEEGDQGTVRQVRLVGKAAAGEREQLRFDVGDLQPGKRYDYELSAEVDDERAAFVSRGGWFRTDDGGVAKIAFGSCADEGEGTGALWQRLASLHPNAVVLLGDTPYIDSSETERQIARHREFYLTPHMQQLLSCVPLYSVWDDHDFGANDTDGRMQGKERSLNVFRKFRPNPTFGTGEEGLFHSFRRGPVEVFILDARYFAGTQVGADTEGALLGAAQWNWLERGLAGSTAIFKVIASSMVFNSSVRPLKPDYWGRYPADYQRLMRLCGKERPGSVILVSGDVHNSRVVHHSAPDRDITELVTSPMHDRVHDATLFSPSAGVEATWGRAHSMLLLESVPTKDISTLRATMFDASGAVFFQRDFSAAPLAARDVPAQSTAMLHKALQQAWQSRDQTITAIEWVLQTGDAEGGGAATVVGGEASSGGAASVRIGTSIIGDLRQLRHLLASAEDANTFADGLMSAFQLPGPLSNEGARVHFTAYATPRVEGIAVGADGSAVGAEGAVALLRRPPYLAADAVGESRAEIVARAPAVGQVIAWINDPLAAYLAQVNGSVQIALGDGRELCLVQDGTNNRPYTSLLRELQGLGMIQPSRIGLDAINAAYALDPQGVCRAMLANERFVYFREQPAEMWPSSALGPRLQPGHSVAVDFQSIPPGSPVLVLVPFRGEIRAAICVAVDQGGAIKGANRADFYVGVGAEAMAIAGEVSGVGVMRRIVYGVTPRVAAPMAQPDPD